MASRRRSASLVGRVVGAVCALAAVAALTLLYLDVNDGGWTAWRFCILISALALLFLGLRQTGCFVRPSRSRWLRWLVVRRRGADYANALLGPDPDSAAIQKAIREKRRLRRAADRRKKAARR